MDKIFDKVKEKYKYLIMFIPIENNKALNTAKSYGFKKIGEDKLSETHTMIILKKDLKNEQML